MCRGGKSGSLWLIYRFPLLSKAMSRELGRSGAAETSTGVYMGWQHCRLRFNLLYNCTSLPLPRHSFLIFNYCFMKALAYIFPKTLTKSCETGSDESIFTFYYFWRFITWKAEWETDLHLIHSPKAHNNQGWAGQNSRIQHDNPISQRGPSVSSVAS